MHLSKSFAIHTGSLPNASRHKHAALALLVSHGNKLELKSSKGDVEAQTLLIAPTLEHELISHGETFTSIYFEQTHPLTRYLQKHYLSEEEVALDVFSSHRGVQKTISRLNKLDLGSLTKHYWIADIKDLDWRAKKTAETLRQNPEANFSSIAQALSLSESRLSHLFKQELGISARQYRLWLQVRKTIELFQTEPNKRITDQALEAGFSDSSHLSNSFRKTIGMSPSAILEQINK